MASNLFDSDILILFAFLSLSCRLTAFMALAALSFQATRDVYCYDDGCGILTNELWLNNRSPAANCSCYRPATAFT